MNSINFYEGPTKRGSIGRRGSRIKASPKSDIISADLNVSMSDRQRKYYSTNPDRVKKNQFVSFYL